MSTRNGRVGFGIIGLNYGLGRCALIQNLPDAHLVAVSARTEATAKQAAGKLGCDWYTDYHKMLERDDIDVIGLYTPSGQHLEIALDIAKAGKHLIVTKPLEITLERVDAIINACEKAGVKLATEFIFRYREGNFAIHQAISEGKFGKMILGEFAFKCSRSQAYYESAGAWRGTWQTDGGGAIMNQTIHSVDQMLWMMGEVDTVNASWGTFTHKIETEDTAAALVTFKSGAIGLLVGTTTFQNDRPVGAYGSDTRRIEVSGEHGSVTMIEDNVAMWKFSDEVSRASLGNPVASNVFQDFVRWTRDDLYQSPTLVKSEESRRAVELVLAIYESARSKRIVKLPLVI